MSPEKELELFAKLDLMLELYRRMEVDIRDLKTGQQDIANRVSRVEGRIEEQSKFLQLALAGRQTRKPAA